MRGLKVGRSKSRSPDLRTSCRLALSLSLCGRPARGADLYGFSAPLRMFRSISWIVRVTVVGVPVCAEIDFFERPAIYRL